MKNRSEKKTIANTWLGQLVNKFVSLFDLTVLNYYKDKEIIRLIKKVRKEDKIFLFRPSELFMIYSLAATQTKIAGDYAEVGVFKGTSAKIICEAKKTKVLHLFDTFQGLPTTQTIDHRFQEKMFVSSYELVKTRLAPYQNVHLYRGIFPKTAETVKDKYFAFVHLDVDLYKSTTQCLEFFYPRMSSGGIILSHDYAQAYGVKKAFEDFFKDKKERIIELPYSQCLVVKSKSTF